MKTIKLPFKVRSEILACGADLKGAFALAKGDAAYLFDGFGDLSELDNFIRYSKAVATARRNLRIRPKVIVCDLHSGYFSTQFAESLQIESYGLQLYKVQHHEAHIASAIMDNAIRGDVLGVAFDGTGYGSDGAIWGGEFFIGNINNFKRISHLDYIPMPGGEACIKEPWRMTISYLYHAFGNGLLKLKIDFLKDIDRKRWAVLKSMIDKKLNSPLTSSAGRLFDVAGSLILNKMAAKFEAELPIELEKIADNNIDDSYDAGSNAEIIKGIVKDLEKCVVPSIISAKFHNSIALMIMSVAKRMKMKKVVLSGGVFQNKFLVNRTRSLLNRNNFDAYTHFNVQTNDYGIPIGQIAIASVRSYARRNTQYAIQSSL